MFTLAFRDLSHRMVLESNLPRTREVEILSDLALVALHNAVQIDFKDGEIKIIVEENPNPGKSIAGLALPMPDTIHVVYQHFIYRYKQRDSNPDHLNLFKIRLFCAIMDLLKDEKPINYAEYINGELQRHYNRDCIMLDVLQESPLQIKLYNIREVHAIKSFMESLFASLPQSDDTVPVQHLRFP